MVPHTAPFVNPSICAHSCLRDALQLREPQHHVPPLARPLLLHVTVGPSPRRFQVDSSAPTCLSTTYSSAPIAAVSCSKLPVCGKIPHSPRFSQVSPYRLHEGFASVRERHSSIRAPRVTLLATVHQRVNVELVGGGTNNAALSCDPGALSRRVAHCRKERSDWSNAHARAAIARSCQLQRMVVWPTTDLCLSHSVTPLLPAWIPTSMKSHFACCVWV